MYVHWVLLCSYCAGRTNPINDYLQPGCDRIFLIMLT